MYLSVHSSTQQSCNLGGLPSPLPLPGRGRQRPRSSSHPRYRLSAVSLWSVPFRGPPLAGAMASSLVLASSPRTPMTGTSTGTSDSGIKPQDRARSMVRNATRGGNVPRSTSSAMAAVLHAPAYAGPLMSKSPRSPVASPSKNDASDASAAREEVYAVLRNRPSLSARVIRSLSKKVAEVCQPTGPGALAHHSVRARRRSPRRPSPGTRGSCATVSPRAECVSGPGAPRAC